MILSATRTAPRSLPRPANAAARSGLVFERKFAAALADSLPPPINLERNPWFEYRDSKVQGLLCCCPDILLFDEECGFYIVIEVKQTWTALALEKLNNVYCPVLRRALDAPIKPLVAVKNLTPQAPRPQSTVTFALLSNQPLIQWLGRGGVSW